MRAVRKGKLAVLVSLVIIFSCQNLSAQSSGNILINSNPQGSLVNLIGEVTYSGVTPVFFERPLVGRYKIEVIRRGYESYKSVAYFSESQKAQLDIKLKRKTRTKAFFRSLIFPGWGQRYNYQKTKATLLPLATIGAVIGYVVVKDDYDDKVVRYNASKVAFAEAERWDELARLEALTWAAQTDANDAEGKLNVVKGLVVGLYIYNLLDAFLFFPDYDSYTEYKAITLKPEISRDRAAISLAVGF